MFHGKNGSSQHHHHRARGSSSAGINPRCRTSVEITGCRISMFGSPPSHHISYRKSLAAQTRIILSRQHQSQQGALGSLHPRRSMVRPTDQSRLVRRHTGPYCEIACVVAVEDRGLCLAELYSLAQRSKSTATGGSESGGETPRSHR